MHLVKALAVEIIFFTILLFSTAAYPAELGPGPAAPAPTVDPAAQQNTAPEAQEPSEDFFQFAALSAEEPCTNTMCGVSNGETVSGTVFIQPNLNLNPDVKKVAYYLNGTQSGKEYTSPFTWGGSDGFDTTTLQNGSYTLSGAYTTRAGDTSFSISFTVDNSNQTPDSTPPVISAVTATNITSSGATLTWTTDETSDSQVQYRAQGTTAWTNSSLNSNLVTNHSVTLNGLSANTTYQYQVKSKDQAGNLSVQPTISTFTTTNAQQNGDFSGVTEGATVSGTVNIGPNLAAHPNVRKAAYYLNGTKSGKVYASPFYWGGVSGDGTAGFDTTTLANGNYSLSMTYTDNTGDHTATVSFNVDNSGVDKSLVYMLGDSITEGNDWAFDLGRDDVINGGVPGEKTFEFLARIQDVYDATPKIVFVMGGINDLRAGATVEDTFGYYTQILEGISSHDIIPIVQSTIHVREIETGANQKVTALNALLRSYAEENSLDYLDLDAYFSENGHIKTEYTTDGVHLNSAAYDIWEPEVLAILERYGI